MDTKPLERFATQARRNLLAAVDAQATAVLTLGSVARSERSETVNRLESEIAAHGREHVIDKVAYIWFNRIIALRFMDACGYTDAGVVSPARGQVHGQPEILADAKRGNLDINVVINKNSAQAINGLLDGTRRSSDAEGEAYALLLNEYCRYWHKAMPFMFEPEGDYTELLVPTGLLADGAILSRARDVLTEDVCADVEVIGWLYQFYISERKDEVFAGFKKNKKAGAGEIPAATQLFTPHWIVRYLVENSLGRLWLLNRPTSRLADKMDYYIAPVDEETNFLRITGPEELTVIDPACGSGHMLTYAFDLTYAIYEEEGYAPSEIPGLILTHNLFGTEIDPRAGALAAFALSMKARAKQRTFFAKNIAPKICVIEPISFGHDELDFLCTREGDRRAEEEFWNQFRYADTLGSLIQSDFGLTERSGGVLSALDGGNDIIHGRTLELAHKAVAQAQALNRKYSVVIANPPYMGSKNMDARLAAFAKDIFPNSKSDLFAMFIERCLGLTADYGATAMITMQSWMFLSSFEALRSQIVRTSPPTGMLHLGERAFDSIGGAVVSTTAFTLEPWRDVELASSYIRAVDGENEAAKQTALLEAARHEDCEWRFTASSKDFAKVPGAPIAYWLSDAMRAAFTKGRSLADVAEPRQGLATAENNRFLRRWWEVSTVRTALSCVSRDEAKASGVRWFPYNKGGEYRKWHGNHEYVVNWERDGAEIRVFGTEDGGRPRSRAQNTGTYFQPSVSWSKVSSGAPAFRMFPPGFIYDVAGTSIFASSIEHRQELVAFANSSVALEMLKAIAPTLNYEVGQIGKLPIVPLGDSDAGRLASESTDVAREDWNEFETSWDFVSPSILATNSGTLKSRYAERAREWRSQARRLQGLESHNNRVVADAYELSSEIPTEVLLHRVSLTRNVEFRYGPGKTGAEYTKLECADVIGELVSYAVGCMFGRYSLDERGLILADQGATLQDYLAKISSPTFTPDADNVIPFVDDAWFEDDIVERFREFLRTAFGPEYFEENLRFVEESLGVNTLRDYFITKAGKSKFYEDHVQRYKKQPIYWMFSSPKGSFNALIYLHRYNPSTVSVVLNEYLREYRGKLEVALSNVEQAAAGGSSAKDQREADHLRNVLVELADYEHDVLYPLATQQIEIDLDDGVKVNYPKFYPAVKKIPKLGERDE
jgi:hypothetical protein